MPGVYAGGDIVTGAATVILAMGAGKRAAAAMDEDFDESTASRRAVFGTIGYVDRIIGRILAICGNRATDEPE